MKDSYKLELIRLVEEGYYKEVTFESDGFILDAFIHGTIFISYHDNKKIEKVLKKFGELK